MRGYQKAILIYDKEDFKHEPVVNKCCSSAKWVPIEVLEEGYGQRFGLWGLGHGPSGPSKPPPPRGRGVEEREEVNF